MMQHKVNKYIPEKSTLFPVATYKRGEKKRPRIFEIGELDGFYVDTQLDRTLHITFEEKDVIVIDIYNTAQAAYSEAGEVMGIIELNLRTGKTKFFTEGR